MNINPDNYETFFLLYVDNELTVEERKAVEEFVDQHEELRVEFLQIQDTVLPVEDIAYSDKKDLYRAQIIESALQERLLLHLDDELIGEALDEMKGLIATNHPIQTEWEILQKTKLDPQTIIFPDKSSLYRSQARIISARITRLAIAAAFIGGGIFIGITLLQKDLSPAISANKKATINNKASAGPKKAQVNEIKDSRNQQSTAREITDPLHANVAANKLPPSTDRLKNTTRVNKGSVKEEPLVAQKKNKNDKDQLVTSDKKKVIFEMILTEQQSNELASLQLKEKSPTFDHVIDINILPADNNLAMTSVFDNSEEAGNNDRILYMKEENITRSKAASFFRKVKRVVERNTKIKTGDNFRIGGFEIAIK